MILLLIQVSFFSIIFSLIKNTISKILFFSPGLEIVCQATILEVYADSAMVTQIIKKIVIVKKIVFK